MAKIRIQTGTTGSRHDPYGWQEITFVKTEGDTVSFLACGLRGDSLTINGETIFSNDNGSKSYQRFTEECGISPVKAEQLYYERIHTEDPIGHPSRYV